MNLKIKAIFVTLLLVVLAMAKNMGPTNKQTISEDDLYKRTYAKISGSKYKIKDSKITVKHPKSKRYVPILENLSVSQIDKHENSLLILTESGNLYLYSSTKEDTVANLSEITRTFKGYLQAYSFLDNIIVLDKLGHISILRKNESTLNKLISSYEQVDTELSNIKKIRPIFWKNGRKDIKIYFNDKKNTSKLLSSYGITPEFFKESLDINLSVDHLVCIKSNEKFQKIERLKIKKEENKYNTTFTFETSSKLKIRNKIFETNIPSSNAIKISKDIIKKQNNFNISKKDYYKVFKLISKYNKENWNISNCSKKDLDSSLISMLTIQK